MDREAKPGRGMGGRVHRGYRRPMVHPLVSVLTAFARP
jgi:hypothetical protein